MNSKLKFRYFNTDLNQDEAAALLSIVDGGENTVIDLSKIIKINARSATEMFSLAVKQKNPALANLAARLAITNEGDDRSFLKKTSQKNPNDALKETLGKKIEGPVENIIDHLMTRNARWTAGVASILMFAPFSSDNKTVTLKEVAIQQNKFLRNRRMPSGCIAFKGFINEIHPADKPSTPRSESFFTSPTYNALREALIFCKSNDLVELTQGVSVGANNTSKNPLLTSRLQRNYWEIKLSRRGDELNDKWGDINDFLASFWETKLS